MPLRNDRELHSRDGTRIAYGVHGAGPALLLTNGLTTTLTFWQTLWPDLRERYRVLTWDMPGHGASGPAHDADSVTPAALCDVMEQVMDAAGVDAAVQLGWSTGCQLVLEFYRRRPARCVALGALFGTAGNALSSTALPLPGAAIETLLTRTPRVAVKALIGAIALLANAPGSALLVRRLQLVDAELPLAQLREVTEHLRRLDPHSVRALTLALQAHSAWDVLPNVTVPFFIAAGDKDPFAPPERIGVPMHEAARGSELLRLSTATHTALLDHARPIGEALLPFLQRHAR